MPNWLPILRRKGCPPLFYSYINHGYKDPYHLELLGIDRGINFHKYVDGWVIIDTEESAYFGETFGRRLQEEGYQRFFMQQCRVVSDDLFKVGEGLRGQNFEKAGTAILLYEFMRFSSSSIRTMPFLTTMVLLQSVVEEQLSEALAPALNLEVGSTELAVALQDLMLASSEVPLATAAVRDVLEIARSINADHPALRGRLSSGDTVGASSILAEAPEIARRVEQHVELYDFLGTDYYVGELTTPEDVLQQVAALLHQDPDVAQASPTPEPPLDERAASLLSTARELHFLRQHRIEAMFKSGRDARGLFVEIGRRLGISLDEFFHLTFDEVQRSMTTGELAIPLSEVHDRIRDYGVFIENGHEQIVVGEALNALREGLPRVSDDTKLNGTTAFAGDYEGPACVVDHRRDIDKVKAGDVLVAPMTSPYHVPGMVKAGAVVTDEGGILSHAAIVSRELKIPCVVGVTGATDLITSGQVVRVVAKPGAGRVEAVA